MAKKLILLFLLSPLSAEIVVDGKLNEIEWDSAGIINTFFVTEPLTYETPEVETPEVEAEEPAPPPQTDDSSIVGDGTSPDYNPFAENVVEREYATPKVASGVTEAIDEPEFVPPTYEDIVQQMYYIMN